MADKYCSTRFKCGEDLDAALEAALCAGDCATRAEAAQKAIEDMEVAAVELTEGERPTVEKTEENGVVKLTFGLPPGATGPQGERGPKGETGPQGETGETGPAGADGQDGVTPHIGENGNWFIGETDTGVPAQGSTGGTDEETAERLDTLVERVGTLEEQEAQTKETAELAYEISLKLGLRMNAFETPPASVDLSAFESDGIIVETKPSGTQTTYTMEFDDNGNPVKITDSNGNETTLTW